MDLESAEQEVESLKQQGNAAFAAGNHAAAAQAYTAALRLCDGMPNPPQLHILHSNRAAALLKLKDWGGALRDAEAALAVQQTWVKALFRKAAALQGLGQLAAAAEAAQHAAQLEPENREVQALLRQLQAASAAGAASAPARGIHSGNRPPATAALLPALLAGAPFEYVPSSDGVAENLLLLFHGLGDRPAAFARLARQMTLPQTAALALGGPQEVPFSDGGRSWYTVFAEDFELIAGRPGEQRRVASLRRCVSALQELLAGLERACGWAARKVHLLGFSQGGTVALELACQQLASGQPLASCVAVSAALLPEQLAQLRREQAQQAEPAADCSGRSSGSNATPVLMTHGSADRVVSRCSVDQTADALRRLHGMPVSVHSVPGKAHAMPRVRWNPLLASCRSAMIAAAARAQVCRLAWTYVLHWLSQPADSAATAHRVAARGRVQAGGGQGREEMRTLMQFWAAQLSLRPKAADLPAGAGEGEVLEIRPGEASLELVGQEQA